MKNYLLSPLEEKIIELFKETGALGKTEKAPEFQMVGQEARGESQTFNFPEAIIALEKLYCLNGANQKGKFRNLLFKHINKK